MESHNEDIIMIEAQKEKKYSTSEIFKIYQYYLQVTAKDIKIEGPEKEGGWGSTLLDGDVLYESEIFPTKKEAKTDVICKYLKQNNLLNFPNEHKKATPKLAHATCNQNPKNLLDIYLSKLNITPTINYISPDFICTIAINYKEKVLQSQSQILPNKRVASYDAAKDMLKQLSYLDEEAMTIYRMVDKNYFRFGTPAPFEENALIELKASVIYDAQTWGASDLKGTLDGIGKKNRSYSNYICAFLNSKVN